MAKFKVRYAEVHSCTIEVEAANAQEARAKVEQLAENSAFGNSPPAYEYTCDKASWGVQDEHENYVN